MGSQRVGHDLETEQQLYIYIYIVIYRYTHTHTHIYIYIHIKYQDYMFVLVREVRERTELFLTCL